MLIYEPVVFYLVSLVESPWHNNCTGKLEKSFEEIPTLVFASRQRDFEGSRQLSCVIESIQNFLILQNREGFSFSEYYLLL